MAVGNPKQRYFMIPFCQLLLQGLVADQVLVFRVGKDEMFGSNFVLFIPQGIRVSFIWSSHHLDNLLILLFWVAHSLLQVLIRYDDFGLFFFGWVLLRFVESFSLCGNLAFGITFFDSLLDGVLDLSPDSLEVVDILLVVEVVISLPTHNEF